MTREVVEPVQYPFTWRLPHMTRAHRRDQNALVARFPGPPEGLDLAGWAAEMGVAAARIQLDGIASEIAPPPADMTLLALYTGRRHSQRGVLGIPTELAHRLVAMTLRRPPAGLDGALSSGEQGALLFSLDRLGKVWFDAGGDRFRVRGFLIDGDQIGEYLGHEPRWQIRGRLQWETGAEQGQSGELYLYLGRFTHCGGGPTSRPYCAERTALWTVNVVIRIGASRLPLKDVKALEPGDTVVLDNGTLPGNGTSCGYPILICGDWKRQGRWLDRQRVEVVSRNAVEDINMTGQDKRDELEVGLANFECQTAGGLEVVVGVEIGEIPLTVDQAAGLLPGSVVRLDKPVGTQVVLRVGRQVIGRGELVDLDGELAVKIAEVT